MNELQLKLARRRALNGEGNSSSSSTNDISVEKPQIDKTPLEHDDDDNNVSEFKELLVSAKIENDISTNKVTDPVCRLFSSQDYNDNNDLLPIFNSNRSFSFFTKSAESTVRTGLVINSHDENKYSNKSENLLAAASGSMPLEAHNLSNIGSVSNFVSLVENYDQEVTVNVLMQDTSIGLAEEDQSAEERPDNEVCNVEDEGTIMGEEVDPLTRLETRGKDDEQSSLDLQADNPPLRDTIEEADPPAISIIEAAPAAAFLTNQLIESMEEADKAGQTATVSAEDIYQKLQQRAPDLASATTQTDETEFRDMSTSYSSPQGLQNLPEVKAAIENELPLLAPDFENAGLQEEIAALREQVREQDALIQSLQLQLALALSDQGERNGFNPFKSSTHPELSDNEVNVPISHRKEFYLNQYGRKAMPTVELGRFNALDESLFETDDRNEFDYTPPNLVDASIDSLFDTVRETEEECSTPTRKAQALHLPQTNTLVRAFANTVSNSSHHPLNKDDVYMSHNNNNNNNNNNQYFNEISYTVSNAAAHLTYEEFTFRFHRCEDLLSVTRHFVLSILGPHSDYCTPPNKKANARYTFHGLQRVEERCRDFFDRMQRTMERHKEWSGSQLNEGHSLVLRDRLEQFVMNQIGEGAFRSTQSKEEDEQLLRQMKLLSFLPPEALDISADVQDNALVSAAVDEFRKIEMYRSPAEKISCVEKCIAVLYEILTAAQHAERARKAAEQRARNELREEGTRDKDPTVFQQSSQDSGTALEASSPLPSSAASCAPVALGADDLLPLFIWIVLRSQSPRLHSNCAYIHAFLSPVRLMGQEGYCLVNLESAIAFLTDIVPESLNMDPAEFSRQLKAAEELMLLEEQG